MKSFKEQLEKDFETTFFNTDEFAEIHELQGNELGARSRGESAAQGGASRFFQSHEA